MAKPSETGSHASLAPGTGSYRRLTDTRALPVRLLDALLSGQEDALALGVCRAVIAGILFVSSLLHLGSVAEYFSDASMINGRFALLAFPSRWSLFFHVRDPLAVQVIWTIGTAALGMWALGLYTRITSLLGMLLWVSMYGRNPLFYAFPDQLSMLFGALMAMMPAGRGFSLDARLRGKGGTVPVWCRRVIQLQLGIVYTSTGLEKTGDTWQVDGTAIYYTLTNPYNRHFDIGPLIATLQPWVLRPMTFMVLIWEVAFGGFVAFHWLRDLAGGRFLRVLDRRKSDSGSFASGVRPRGWPIPDLRWLFLGFGVLVHVGIQLGVYVVLFSPLMVGTYAGFLTSAELRRLARTLRRPFSRLARRVRRSPTPADDGATLFEG
jgi:hypothetical protein